MRDRWVPRCVSVVRHTVHTPPEYLSQLPVPLSVQTSPPMIHDDDDDII